MRMNGKRPGETITPGERLVVSKSGSTRSTPRSGRGNPVESGSVQRVTHTVRSGDTVEALAGRMSSSGDKVALFRMLNNLAPGEGLSPGRRVKLVVEPRR